MARTHILLGYTSFDRSALPTLICLTTDADEAARVKQEALAPDGWAAVEHIDGARGHRKVNDNPEATRGKMAVRTGACQKSELGTAVSWIAELEQKLKTADGVAADQAARIAELEKQLSEAVGKLAAATQIRDSSPRLGADSGAAGGTDSSAASSATASSPAAPPDGKTSNSPPDGGNAEAAKGKGGGGDGKSKRTA